MEIPTISIYFLYATLPYVDVNLQFSYVNTVNVNLQMLMLYANPFLVKLDIYIHLLLLGLLFTIVYRIMG